MSLVLGKLETPHREKSPSREVQHGPEIMEVCYFLGRVGKGGLTAREADQSLENLKVSANREVGSSGCTIVP